MQAPSLPYGQLYNPFNKKHQGGNPRKMLAKLLGSGHRGRVGWGYQFIHITAQLRTHQTTAKSLK
jgi:hypothetical protein